MPDPLSTLAVPAAGNFLPVPACRQWTGTEQAQTGHRMGTCQPNMVWTSHGEVKPIPHGNMKQNPHHVVPVPRAWHLPIEVRVWGEGPTGRGEEFSMLFISIKKSSGKCLTTGWNM